MMPFTPKAKLMFSGRRNWRQKLKDKFQNNNSPVAWFHSASLGEFEQTRPLIEKFNQTWPDFKILISFYSPSGYEIRKNYQPSFHISYLPFDNRRNARYWLETTKPQIIFFTKYEFWYHFTDEIKKRRILLISFSSIFRESQVYFSWYGKFNRNILKNFSHFFVQNEESVKLLNSIGISSVEQTGDTRFDRVSEIAGKPISIDTLEKFKGGSQLVVCGSIWDSDMPVITEFIHSHGDDCKFVIAPHEVDDKSVEGITSALKDDFIRYTRFEENTDSKILVLDTVGLLSSVYSYADAAYIGGAFGKGLHNVLEAAVFKIPVFFGNSNYRKFNEAVDLVKLGAAFPVATGVEMLEKFSSLKDAQSQIAAVISEYFSQKAGATNRIIEYCREIIK